MLGEKIVNGLKHRGFGRFPKDERSSQNKDTGQRKVAFGYLFIANF